MSYQHKASTPQKVPEHHGEVPSQRLQFKRQLNAMTIDQQQQALAPDRPLSMSTKAVQLSAAPSPQDNPHAQTLLQVGAQGEAVRYLQNQLNAAGANLTADGIFGPKTRQAVMAFQGQAGLGVDGIVGPMTWGALKPSSQTTPTTPAATPAPQATSPAGDTPTPPSTPTPPPENKDRPTPGSTVTPATGAPLVDTVKALMDPGTNAADVPALLKSLGEGIGISQEVQVNITEEGTQNELSGTVVDTISSYLSTCRAHLQSNGGSSGMSPETLNNINLRLEALISFYSGIKADAIPSPAAASVISLMMGEIGKVSSNESGGKDPETGKRVRKGWERLLEYFNVAYGGQCPPSEAVAIKFLDGPKCQSWCGIFVAWALKTAGVPCGNWVIGGNAFKGLESRPTFKPARPGDVVACIKNQHFCVAVRDEGGNVFTIDGNTNGGGGTMGGQIRTNTRAKSGFYGYMMLP